MTRRTTGWPAIGSPPCPRTARRAAPTKRRSSTCPRNRCSRRGSPSPAASGSVTSTNRRRSRPRRPSAEPSYSAAPLEPEPRFEPRYQPPPAAPSGAPAGAGAPAASAGLAAGGFVRTVVAARNARQPLDRIRAVRRTGRRNVGPASARPPLRIGRGLGGTARRAGGPAALRRVRSPRAVAPFGGIPRLRRTQLRAHERAPKRAPERAGVRAAAPRPGRGHAPAPAATPVAAPGRRATTAATGPAATARARAPARRRGPAGRGHRWPGRGAPDRRPVGCRPVGTAAGPAVRGGPPSSPRRLSWELPHIGLALGWARQSTTVLVTERYPPQWDRNERRNL